MTPSIRAGVAFCLIAWPGSTFVLAWHSYDLCLSLLGWVTLTAIFLSAFTISYMVEKKYRPRSISMKRLVVIFSRLRKIRTDKRDFAINTANTVLTLAFLMIMYFVVIPRDAWELAPIEIWVMLAIGLGTQVAMIFKAKELYPSIIGGLILLCSVLMLYHRITPSLAESTHVYGEPARWYVYALMLTMGYLSIKLGRFERRYWTENR